MELLKKCWRRATIATMVWLVGACVVQAAETPLAPSPAAATKDSTKDSTKVAAETLVAPSSAVPGLALVLSGGVFTSNPVVSITGSTDEVRYTLDGSLPA